jgi:hypothetical protein
MGTDFDLQQFAPKTEKRMQVTIRGDALIEAELALAYIFVLNRIIRLRSTNCRGSDVAGVRERRLPGRSENWRLCRPDGDGLANTSDGGLCARKLAELLSA